MKKKYSILLIVLMAFTHQAIFSQVTFTISNVQVNNSSIGAGSPIQMGIRSTVNVKFHLVFSKPNNSDYSNTSFVITGYNSFGGSKQLRTPEGLYLGLNNTGFTGDYSVDLDALNYDFTEGSFLRADLTQTSGNPPLEWHSNQIKITKTPVYNVITQDPAAIVCNQTTPVRFTITSDDANNNSSLQWSYNSSWSYYDASANSIRLLPNTYPLGNVSVIPTIHGASQGTYTTTPVLTPYTNTASILGVNSYCNFLTPSTFTINAGVGNTVTWSSSNPAIATVSGGTNTQATVTSQSQGTFTLSAVITNLCGQTTTKTKIISVGAPILPSSATITGATNTSYSQTLDYTLNGDATNGGISYLWSIDAPINDNGGPTCAWQVISGQGTKNVKLLSGCIATTAVVKVVATSNCGVSNTKYIYVAVGSTACVPTLQVLQNPLKNGNLVVNVIQPPCGSAKNANLNISNDIKIYDFSGNAVFIDKQNSDELRINNLQLKKGIYILQVTTESGDIMKNKIIIQ